MRILTRGFLVLWVAMFVAMAGMSMVSPLLPVYVKNDLGGPAIAVALSFSGVAIAQMISSPFVGRLGDRFGTKPFIVGGFCVYALGAIGYLFAHHWQLVVFFRIFSGFGAAGIFPMTLAYVGRLAPRGAEGRFMGWFSVAQIAGFGVGPLIGGGLRDAFGSSAAFAAMAIMLGGMAFMTLLLLPPRPEQVRRESPPRSTEPLAVSSPGRDDDDDEPVTALPMGELVRRPAVQAAVLFMMLMSLGMGAASSFTAIFVVDRAGLNTGSTLFVGVLLSSRSLINATLQPFTGMLADRWNRVMLVTIGLAISGAAQLLIPLVPRDLVETSLFGGVMTIAPAVLAVVMIAGVGEAIAFPAQQAVFVDVGRRVGMASLMGLNSMGNSIGFLAGSLIGAAVVAQFGISAVFTYAGLMMFVGIALFLVLMRRAARLIERERQAATAAAQAAGVAAGAHRGPAPADRLAP
ncbi:MAG: MFS transporter [Chloroflexi bacterium]|nr:MFS transporter [Chloroflexota bacterium]MDA1003205.1 MFS transporter [Chloroflexota bacterium]